MLKLKTIKSELKTLNLRFVGIQKSISKDRDLVLFDDNHKSTIAVKVLEFSRSKVKSALKRSELRWNT